MPSGLFRAHRPELLLLAGLLVAPYALIHVGFSYDLLGRVLIWGLMGLGLDILFGWAGLLSFGQAAFVGTGGFVSAYLLVSGTIASVWLALAAGTLAAGLLGLAIGWLAVRRIGIYFTMITLAFGQMAYFVENSPLSRWTGGENGIAGVPVPTLGFGANAIRITAGLPMYWLMAALFFAGYLVARRIVGSPFGAVLRAIKENAARAAMLGHAVPLYRLGAFVIAALYAGLSGGLLGSFQSYMPPDAFSLETSGELVVQTVVGGVGTLIGPTVGAIVWLWLRDNLQLVPGVGALWKLILGIVFVGLVIALRRGICGEIARRWWPGPMSSTPGEPAHDAGMPGDLGDLPLPMPHIARTTNVLEALGLSKVYGGLRAVDGVSFAVRTGSIHAVIGPNGAGKSTLFKMLLEEVRPSGGEVRLGDRSITGLGVTRAAQLGIAKSNQLNQLFLNLTVRENLRVAALARGRGAFRLDMMASATGYAPVERQIDAMLDVLDLGARAGTPARILAYGEKRRLEIGLALATNPCVLLLDEPLAGMSPAERKATRGLIRDIGRTRTLLVVEHDLDAIFELADRITVLHEGRLLAEGAPGDIQRSQAVQDAYLGGLEAYEPA